MTSTLPFTRIAAIAITLAVTAASGVAWAQPAGGPPGQGAPPGQGSGQERPSGPTPLPLLAANAVLQQDLDLTADQRRRLAEAETQFTKLARASAPSAGGGAPRQNSEAEAYAKSSLDTILTVAQSRRLQQVMLQLAGLCRTTLSPRLGQGLALTADQTGRIRALCGDSTPPGRQSGPQQITPSRQERGGQRQGSKGPCVDFDQVARSDQ